MNIGVILGAASGFLGDSISTASKPSKRSQDVAEDRGDIRTRKQAAIAPSVPDGWSRAIDEIERPDQGQYADRAARRQAGWHHRTQTIFPGSIHPSGEPIEWAEDGEPGHVEYKELGTACSRSQCALLARYCPSATTVDEAHHALAQADPRIMAQIKRWHIDTGTTRSRNDHDTLQVTEPDTAHLTRQGRRLLGETARIDHPPLQVTEHDIAWVWTALTFISSRERKAWFEGGGALFLVKSWPEELRRAMWDCWSDQLDVPPPGEGKKFKQSGQDDTWQSFKRDYDAAPITLGTIIFRAQQAGWDGRTLKALPDEFDDLPDPIARDEAGVQPSQAAASDLPMADDEFYAEIKRLAGLPPVQYERQRKDAADKLGMRVTTLDKLVNAERGNEEDGERQGMLSNYSSRSRGQISWTDTRWCSIWRR